MNTQPAAPESFDRSLALPELLSAAERTRIESALTAMLGCQARLLEAGQERPSAGAAPVKNEIENVAWIEAPDAESAPLQAAAALTGHLLRYAARYRMAACLHQEATQADYDTLRAKHEALEQSEAKYRELAENLEQRVAEQVRLIERTQRQLYQAEKYAALGVLAGGMAHEINNPLGFIGSNLVTAARYVDRLAAYGARLGDGEPPGSWKALGFDALLEDFPTLIRESQEGVERIARIVADLRGFTGIDGAGWGETDMAELIQRVAGMALPMLRERAELVLDIGVLPPLHCHRAQLSQALYNLLRNAAQAMTQRGEIRLRAAETGGALRIEVADNGCGIAPEHLGRIFEPFYTTRDVGQGTGLGLTVARDVVEAHGGRIEVESDPGKGAVVTITLPVAGNGQGRREAERHVPL
jgi:signal transduction histidine kinase